MIAQACPKGWTENEAVHQSTSSTLALYIFLTHTPVFVTIADMKPHWRRVKTGLVSTTKAPGPRSHALNETGTRQPDSLRGTSTTKCPHPAHTVYAFVSTTFGLSYSYPARRLPVLCRDGTGSFAENGRQGGRCMRAAGLRRPEVQRCLCGTKEYAFSGSQ